MSFVKLEINSEVFNTYGEGSNCSFFVKVPKLTFVDFVEKLIIIKNLAKNNCGVEWHYDKEIIPYHTGGPAFWTYFDQIKGNSLFYKKTDKIYFFKISDFDMFCVLRFNAKNKKSALLMDGFMDKILKVSDDTQNGHSEYYVGACRRGVY